MSTAPISPYMTLKETAAYCRRHYKTVLAAVQDKQLKGYQRTARGTWSVHREDADRWLRGEKPSRGQRRFSVAS